VCKIALSTRQKNSRDSAANGPITGEHIASQLDVTRAALRSDLAILVMSGILDARPKVGYFYTGKNTLGMLQEEISVITVRDVMSVPVVIGTDKSAYDAVVSMFMDDAGSVL
jgi:biotin operon repressor